MSATLPKLDILVGTEEGFVNLIENREIYYNNPLFKNRVTIDYSLLNETDDIDKKVIEKIVNLSKGSTKNILVEFINKNTAMKMYKEIGKIYEEKGIARETLLMTGDDNKIERKQIIDKVKEQKNITLIATQVIEAGINIDMDIGFKDISILDSEEQFLGRINRSCMKSGSVVYFFNLDKASTIYKNDYRKNDSVTLKEEKIKDILRTKRFDQYYKIIMEMIENDLYRHDDRNIDKFRKSKVLKLDYEAITERMELIDDDKKEYQVFLNRKIKDKEGKIISGKNAWNNYVKLLENKDMKYAEKKVKLSYIIEKMNYFMYKVNTVNNSYTEVVGDIFYIENGEKYFTNGKFDRELFKNKGC
jgi:CRISPR-associated endonuclease/helicase Cas3